MTTAELIGWTKRNPAIAICGVLSLALAVAIYIRSDAVANANAELDAKSAEARRYEANITNAAQLKEQYDQLVAANKEIEARLIRATDIGINQQFFYKLESDTGVKLSELSQDTHPPRKQAIGAHFAPVTFNLTADGTFAQVMAFLRALESGDHFYRVSLVACTAGRSGPVSLNLSLELLARP